jgi:hypothetical protein
MSSWANKQRVRRAPAPLINIYPGPTLSQPIISSNTSITNIISVVIVYDGNDAITNILTALHGQTSPNWIVLVVVTIDNIDRIRHIIDSDSRFKIINCNLEMAKSYNFYRNYGISSAYTDWVTFINIGDSINNTFISDLESQIKLHNSVECIYFRVIKHQKIIVNDANSLTPDYSFFCYKTLLYYRNFKFDDSESLGKKLLTTKYTRLYNINYTSP